jgi:hypothetical protein
MELNPKQKYPSHHLNIYALAAALVAAIASNDYLFGYSGR